MTGSAIDEDGSHQELPYWNFFKANNFTLGAVWALSPIYFRSKGGRLFNQDKLFWKLPSPLKIPEYACSCFWHHMQSTKWTSLTYGIRTNDYVTRPGQAVHLAAIRFQLSRQPQYIYASFTCQHDTYQIYYTTAVTTITRFTEYHFIDIKILCWCLVNVLYKNKSGLTILKSPKYNLIK